MKIAKAKYLCDNKRKEKNKMGILKRTRNNWPENEGVLDREKRTKKSKEVVLF